MYTHIPVGGGFGGKGAFPPEDSSNKVRGMPLANGL